jgi:hypothetical protein
MVESSLLLFTKADVLTAFFEGEHAQATRVMSIPVIIFFMVSALFLVMAKRNYLCINCARAGYGKK